MANANLLEPRSGDEPVAAPGEARLNVGADSWSTKVLRGHDRT